MNRKIEQEGTVITEFSYDELRFENSLFPLFAPVQKKKMDED